MTNSTPVLQIKSLTKNFPTPDGHVEVLRGVDLMVERGDFVMITGPSGSGKSTILNLAAMLDTPTTGQVIFQGRDVSHLNDTELCEIRKKEIGMVFQKFCLLPHRSVIDNVLFRFRYLEKLPHDMNSHAYDILKEIGLENIRNRSARLLSAGEMQRTAIARAVVLRPGLLVADEPTGNLDGASTHTVMQCFQKLNKNGLTIIMVTHNQNLLEFCTKHKICKEGILV
ncbi:MAG: ABC transporter ATP-binding protein [Kiritimatiellae bacterium]|nr:ABC transporter ATP-binding protein [Kiritimatiellia bacterium]